MLVGSFDADPGFPFALAIVFRFSSKINSFSKISTETQARGQRGAPGFSGCFGTAAACQVLSRSATTLLSEPLLSHLVVDLILLRDSPLFSPSLFIHHEPDANDFMLGRIPVYYLYLLS